MNIAAPLAVLAWRYRMGAGAGAKNARWIMPASAGQIALLWFWHLPVPMAFAFATPGGEALMHVSLFAAALWFWSAILDEAEAARWQALGALLFTGKLFCLLGVILTFAPRSLYMGAAEVLGSGADPDALLVDQQVAGLMMLVACPLVYVLAGVVIAARWLAQIDARPASFRPEESG